MSDVIFTGRGHVTPTRVQLLFRLPSGERRAVTVERAHDTPAVIEAIKEALAADRVQSKEQIRREGLRRDGR